MTACNKWRFHILRLRHCGKTYCQVWAEARPSFWYRDENNLMQISEDLGQARTFSRVLLAKMAFLFSLSFFLTSFYLELSVECFFFYIMRKLWYFFSFCFERACSRPISRLRERDSEFYFIKKIVRPLYSVSIPYIFLLEGMFGFWDCVRFPQVVLRLYFLRFFLFFLPVVLRLALTIFTRTLTWNRPKAVRQKRRQNIAPS